MKKAAFHNLGCNVNAYELEGMEESLRNAGYDIVPFTEKADVYVINTCTVTRVADQKSRQMISRAKTLNPDVIAFTRDVSKSLGPERKWVHYGMTSTDVVDTAQGLRLKHANDIIRKDIDDFMEVLKNLTAKW